MDADVIFYEGRDPLQGLLIGPRRPAGPSGADAPLLPDLQMLSDHSDGVHRLGHCPDRLLRTLSILAHSSLDWRAYTYERLYALAAAALPETDSRSVDVLRMDCHVAGDSYSDPAACLSTGFWLAQPTAGARALFDELTRRLLADPDAWEQAVFNEYLGVLVKDTRGATLPLPVTLVALDPRLAGNYYEQRCALAANLTGAVAGLPQPVQPVLTHLGYVARGEKAAIMRDIGGGQAPAP